MTEKARRLFWEIIDCGKECANNLSHKCRAAYNSQCIGCNQGKCYRIPEPWNGDIENAKILFVGINPGDDAHELYPTLQQLTEDREVEDFFENRFESHEGREPYVLPRGHRFLILQRDGTRRSYGGMWNYVLSIAAEKILKRDIGNVIIGRDYAITEIVHCKTRNVGGLDDACYSECRRRFFDRVINTAEKAEYVVFIGAANKQMLERELELKLEWNKWVNGVMLGGKERKVVFVKHNAARGVSYRDVEDVDCLS